MAAALINLCLYLQNAYNHNKFSICILIECCFLYLCLYFNCCSLLFVIKSFAFSLLLLIKFRLFLKEFFQCTFIAVTSRAVMRPFLHRDENTDKFKQDDLLLINIVACLLQFSKFGEVDFSPVSSLKLS